MHHRVFTTISAVTPAMVIPITAVLSLSPLPRRSFTATPLLHHRSDSSNIRVMRLSLRLMWRWCYVAGCWGRLHDDVITWCLQSHSPMSLVVIACHSFCIQLLATSSQSISSDVDCCQLPTDRPTVFTAQPVNCRNMDQPDNDRVLLIQTAFPRRSQLLSLLPVLRLKYS